MLLGLANVSSMDKCDLKNVTFKVEVYKKDLGYQIVHGATFKWQGVTERRLSPTSIVEWLVFIRKE